MEMNKNESIDGTTDIFDVKRIVKNNNNTIETDDLTSFKIKEENLDVNLYPCDFQVKEEFPTSNVITVRIKKKKGAPRRSEPFHLYTPELFQSLFGFSIYQCYGDSEWKKVLKNKSGTLHFRANGRRIHDNTLSDVKRSKLKHIKNPISDEKSSRLKQLNCRREKKRIKSGSPKLKNLKNDIFNVKVETVFFNTKEETCNPIDYVSRCKGSRPFQCNLCNMCFKEHKTCKNHIEQVHFKIRHHKCNLCDKMFYLQSAVQKHINAVHLKLKPYICKKCKASFSSNSGLTRHLTTHEETGRYECPTCGKRIRHSSTFQEHMDIHNNVKYTCVECEIDYSSKKTLRIHMLKHNPQFSPQINCFKCNKVFINTAILKKHERVVHPTIKYPCSACKKSFPLPLTLQKHISNVHSNSDKIYKCKHCGSSFRSEKYLKNHIQRLHTHTFYCAHCPDKFSNKPKLAYHLKRYHASISAYKPLSCNRCSRRFITYNHVKRHIMKTHFNL